MELASARQQSQQSQQKQEVRTVRKESCLRPVEELKIKGSENQTTADSGDLDGQKC